MKNFIYLFLLFSLHSLADSNVQCDANCTFVLLNQNTGTYETINKLRSTKRLSPFSTFKIPNSLIAIELGVVKTLEQKLDFDRPSFPVQSWWPKTWYQTSLNLKEAFQHSALPIYQHIAVKIGEEDMGRHLSKFEFGNTDISSGIDTFWLNGSLKISAKEQVDFLYKLNNYKLPLSDTTITTLKKIMLVEETDQYRLYAKTGGGYIAKERALGWYVGFVENNAGVFYFALNLEKPTFDTLKDKRKSMAIQQLKKAGVLP